jgi:hypothetical protein
MAQCLNCGNEFKAGKSTARFCSPKCKMAFHRKKLSVTEGSVTENVTEKCEGVTASVTADVTAKDKLVTENVTLKLDGVTENVTATGGVVTENVTDDVTDEPELDPTVLYLTALSQRVDALAVEVTELKKVGSAIKIDSMVPVIKGMVEEGLKEIEGRIVKLEEMVESLEDRVSKIEELLQDFQTGISVGWKGGGHSSRHTSKDNGNGELLFSKSKHAAGILPRKNPLFK